jgi:poly(3-hydroxybutyrate) depolymerase
MSLRSLAASLTVLAAVLAPSVGSAAERELALKTAPGVSIAGVLRTPDGSDARAPLVVFLSGSGKQNRDADNMVKGYAPHKRWAELLAAEGIATTSAASEPRAGTGAP